jgi:hypothetical protein
MQNIPQEQKLHLHYSGSLQSSLFLGIILWTLTLKQHHIQQHLYQLTMRKKEVSVPLG